MTNKKIENIINDTHLLVINKTMTQSPDNFNSKQKMTRKKRIKKQTEKIENNEQKISAKTTRKR